MKKYFYAVHKGVKQGVYDNWQECQQNTSGVAGAVFKKFSNKRIADYFSNTGILLQQETMTLDTVINTDVNTNNDDTIIIYTDGSCINNGKRNARGGIGVYFGPDDTRNISEPFTDKPTNQRAELYAVIKGIKQVINKDIKIIIYTDSEYLIKCMTQYVAYWVKNNWKKRDGTVIANKEYICELYNLTITRNIQFKHIRSHTGSKDIHSIGNDAADKLAIAGANKNLKNNTT